MQNEPSIANGVSAGVGEEGRADRRPGWDAGATVLASIIASLPSEAA